MDRVLLHTGLKVFEKKHCDALRNRSRELDKRNLRPFIEPLHSLLDTLGLWLEMLRNELHNHIVFLIHPESSIWAMFGSNSLFLSLSDVSGTRQTRKHGMIFLSLSMIRWRPAAKKKLSNLHVGYFYLIKFGVSTPLKLPVTE